VIGYRFDADEPLAEADVVIDDMADLAGVVVAWNAHA
jgi:hypothetical protein